MKVTPTAPHGGLGERRDEGSTVPQSVISGVRLVGTPTFALHPEPPTSHYQDDGTAADKNHEAS